jgi:hypothetical protein
VDTAGDEVTASAALALDAIFSSIHVLVIVAVPDGRETNYSVICQGCGWESGQFVKVEYARTRQSQPCEAQAVEAQAAQNRACRLAAMKELAAAATSSSE